jgi:hypothetical protein
MQLGLRVLPIVVVSALISVPAVAKPSGLDEKSVLEALAYGRSGEPKPYQLSLSGHVTGIVYTPFIRVAIASHAAHLRGRELAEEDLPDWLTAPLVYFAIRRGPQVPGSTSASTFRASLAPHGVLPVARIARDAEWVATDSSVLERFAPGVPYDDIVAVAAFPVSAIKAGWDVWLWTEREGESGRSHGQMRGGMITDSDIASWR